MERPKPYRDWAVKIDPPANTSADDAFVYVQISPEDLAMYVTCDCGISPLEFIAWLAKEVDFLVEMDGCNK